MAIRPPRWAKQAVPEVRKGWVDPNTGELLVSSRFTQEQVDDFYGVNSFQEIQDMNQEGKIEAMMAESAKRTTAEVNTHTPIVKAAEEEEWQAEDLNQDGIVDELETMTKKQLEDLGREHGVELDRRKNKATLIEMMKGVLSK